MPKNQGGNSKSGGGAGYTVSGSGTNSQACVTASPRGGEIVLTRRRAIIIVAETTAAMPATATRITTPTRKTGSFRPGGTLFNI